jgi:phospho-N-acetylmuramoyl-pentapeptide-transferase
MTIFHSTTNHDLVQVFLLALLGIVVATVITPLYTYIAYRFEFWKRMRTDTITGEKATVMNKLHAAKHQRHIPTMAGVIALVTVTVITMALNLSREQTWLPLAAFMAAGVVGLIDDVINIRGYGRGVAGLRSSLKFALITIVAGLGAWFFYYKLGYNSIAVPFVGDIDVGWWLIPIFTFVVVATGNAVNITDGLDGLAGGLLVSAFAAFGTIAFLQGNFGIAGFCLTVVGALLSYVWFNIFPARFFMGDVGSFAFGTALGVVAMLTDTLLLLPVIGGLFVVEVSSSLLQILSKRFRGKKIFISAPIHHHFEALGWPETKVTMRFWIIGQVLAASGVALALIGDIL